MSLVLGLNSGSSFDAMDAVLVEITDGPDGYPTRPRFVDALTHQWPDEVAGQVLKAFDNGISIFELNRLNYLAGGVYAEAALSLMAKAGVSSTDLEVIGYDGQTIYQEPPEEGNTEQFAPDQVVDRWLRGGYGAGLQIGEPSVVAAYCDVPVVTQFRPMDHALGGTGAPLMQYLDFVAFRDMGHPVLTLNIGGIANCQLADADRKKMMAFDTGPGNVMIDHAMRRFFNREYDPEGSTAARGTVDQAVLDELLQHPFFKRHPPRSAWRLDFGSTYADNIIDKYSNVAPEDLVATFTEFSARAIVKSIRDHVTDLDSMPLLLASGGGVRNPVLFNRIAHLLPPSLRFTTSDEFGIPAPYKEAVKFATLAHATVNHLANNIPAASGANRFAVLGKLVMPPSAVTFGADFA